MRIDHSRCGAIAVLLAVCAMASACKPKERATNGADTTMAGMGQAAAGSTSAAGMQAGSTATAAGSTAAATGQPATLTDANIFALLDELNAADSATAAQVMPQLKSADAKSFAKLMMGEHHALRLQGELLAKKLNITLQAPADDPLPAAVKAEMDALQGKTGAALDSTYISQEVGIHKAAIDLAGQWHDAAQNAQLKSLITQAGPTLKKHLDRAEAIEKKMQKTA